jgi:hypothetical protein
MIIQDSARTPGDQVRSSRRGGITIRTKQRRSIAGGVRSSGAAVSQIERRTAQEDRRAVVSDEAVSNQDLDVAVCVAATAATITSREDNCSSD